MKRLPEREPIPSYRKAGVALALSWTAGFVDLVGYLSLKHILTANMSGNTISLGQGLVAGDSGLAAIRGWALLMFVCGLFIAAFVHEFGERRKFHSVAAITLGLESLMLIVYAIGGQHALQNGEITGSTPHVFLLLALSTLAMGIQNATLTRVGLLSVRTTHVTGTISKFAESASRYLIWTFDRLRHGRSLRFTLNASVNQRDFIVASLTALLWIFFLLGGISAAYLRNQIQLLCLAIPIFVLLLLVAMDIRKPLVE